MDVPVESAVPQITAQTLKQGIEGNDQYVLLDVRTPEEYGQGKIEGSINMLMDKLACDISAVVPDTTTKVFVYCLSGSHSIHAVATMVKMGYVNVYDVKSGLLAWRAGGLPIVE